MSTPTRAASPLAGPASPTPAADRPASPGAAAAGVQSRGGSAIENRAGRNSPHAAPHAAPVDFVQSETPAAPAFGEGDDAMMMPAPSSDYLAHRAHPPAPPTRPPGARAGFRNTLIPVLLTTAVLMLVTALMKFVVHPDAPLAAMPTWLAVVLAGAAVAFVGIAALNVLQVRRQIGSVPPTGKSVL